MPKLIPVADALSKPFWDAVNQRRLVLQHCAACDRLQYPRQQACQVCNSAAGLTWKEVEGRGHIATYIVIEDGRLNRRMPDQPYNLAMVTLDADPRVNFYSNLPGTPPYKVPVGAAVEVTFEEVAPGQLIHEWRVVASDGSILRGFLSADGKWRLPVEAEKVDPLYRRMLVSAEDARFASHPGVDPLAVLRASAQLALSGRIVSGASTLTMQVVRLLE